MKLTESDVTKFQVLYRKHFGEEIDRDAARKQLGSLVRQIELVYRPVSYGQLEQQFTRHLNQVTRNE